MAAKDDFLIDTMVDMGLVTREQVDAVQADAEAAGEGLLDTLVKRGELESGVVTAAKATYFGVESIPLAELRLPDDDPRLNPNGGAIALGHPLGMSGARLIGTAMIELEKKIGRYALCTMCVGVGQGMATIIEKI